MLTKSDFFISNNSLEFLKAYESFSWLEKDISQKNGLQITAFGDLIFRNANGSVSMLDLIEGSIVDIADSVYDFQNKISTKTFQEEMLLSNLILSLKEKNILRNEHQVYAFKVPMILGGKAQTENVHLMDLKVWIHIIGQIHQQVKSLPPGSEITKFLIRD
jgi:hypothetical protein